MLLKRVILLFHQLLIRRGWELDQAVSINTAWFSLGTYRLSVTIQADVTTNISITLLIHPDSERSSHYHQQAYYDNESDMEAVFANLRSCEIASRVPDVATR